MMCMFVQGLPGPIKRLLQSSVMSIKELLAQSWAIIKDKTTVRELVAAVQPTQITQSSQGMHLTATCSECNGPNHFTRDYMKRKKTTCAHSYQCNKTSYQIRYCPGNKFGGKTSALVYTPERKWTQCYLPIVSTLMEHYDRLSSNLGAHGPFWAQSYVSLS